MSIDKNDRGNNTDEQPAGQIESLDPSEIDGADLEKISGGYTIRLEGVSAVCVTGGC
jgi:hypothetical protein